MIKVKVFLLPFSVHLISDFYFPPTVCWNFLSRLLDIHKDSAIIELVFFRGFWTAAARDWSGFMGHFRLHIWDQYLYVSYEIHKW